MSLRPLRGLTDDRDALVGFLDVLRDAVVRKMEDLSDDGMRARLVDSGTTLGGIVKHLVDVERFWFHSSFAGREIEFPWTDDDPDADWRVEDDETLELLVDRYREAFEESNRIAAGAGSLDDVVADAWNEE
ncbi:DUF664 domain-containing protein [bacterium]|nr:DUF664 domain-containing protein [bacterium]